MASPAALTGQPDDVTLGSTSSVPVHHAIINIHVTSNTTVACANEAVPVARQSVACFMNERSCVQIKVNKIDKGIENRIKDLTESPHSASYLRYPRDLREGLTKTNTNEITAWGLLYVVCICLEEWWFHRTARTFLM